MPQPSRRTGRARAAAVGAELREKLPDEARFLKTWLDKPLVTGAVAPSGKALAKRMAGFIEPLRAGPVIELGPGTGAVTEAIVRRGVAPERLILVEFDRDFCKLLEKRFPGAKVIRGDAYALAETLRDEPVYFYNLACYEVALGKPQAALTWLRLSVEMDRHYRERALADPDLAAIAEAL